MKRWHLVLGGLIAALFCGWFAPVTVECSAQAQQLSSSGFRDWDAASEPEDSVLSLRFVGTRGGEFTPPRESRPISTPLHRTALGDLSWNEQMGRYVGNPEGSPAIFSGVWAAVEVDVLLTDVPSMLEITRTHLGRSLTEVVNLPSAGGPARWKTISVSSLSVRLTQSQLFHLGTQMARPPSPSEASVAVGGQIHRGDNPSSLIVWWLLVRAFGTLLGVILTALALLLAGLFAVAIWIYPSITTAREAAIWTIAGTAALAIAVNSLTYLVSVRVAVLVIVLSTSALGLWRMRRREWIDLRMVLRGLKVDLATLLVPATLGLWPITLWGSDFNGGYNTDLFEYSAAGSIGVHHSMLEMSNLAEARLSGTVPSGVGIVWRSIDSMFGAAIGVVTPYTTTQGFSVAVLVLLLVFGLALLHFSDTTSWLQRAWVSVLLTFPMLVGLSYENYFSQFFFLAFIPGLLLALAQAADSDRDPRAREQWLPLALIASAAIAAYPYFFVVVAAALGIAVAVVPTARAQIGKSWYLICGGILVGVNGAFLTIANYGETKQYEESLDAIARMTLLDGFTVHDFRGVLFGVMPYHARPMPTSDWPLVLGAGHGALAEVLLRVARGLNSSSLAFWIVATALVALALRVRSKDRLLLLSSVLVPLLWLAFAAWYALGDRPYIAWKAGWTAAVLVIPVLALVSLRRPRPVTLVAMIAVAVVWIPTNASDKLKWSLPINHSQVVRERMSVADDLHAARDGLDSTSGDVAVFVPNGAIRSDFDRTLIWHIAAMVRDEDRNCIGCVGSLMSNSTAVCPPGVELVIAIDADREPLPCGAAPIIRTATTEIGRVAQ